jgi:hypothetical protein
LLHGRCWSCGTAVRSAAERRATSSPRCAACDVELREAKKAPVIPRVVDLQARLTSLLSFVVNRGAPPGELDDITDRIATFGREPMPGPRRPRPLPRLPVNRRYKRLFGGVTDTELPRQLAPPTAVRPQDRYHRAILLVGDLNAVGLKSYGDLGGDDSWSQIRT